MITDKDFREWQKELKEILGNYNISKFKKFYNKGLLKGIYTVSLPKKDEVIEIAMREMVLASTLTTDEQKKEAQKWLDERKKQ